jgi:hypothetical protein
MRAKAAFLTFIMMALAIAVSGFTAPRSGPSPDGLPPTVKYTITLKAWIPFESVVDPFIPTALPYAITNKPFVLGLVDPNCLTDKDGDLKGTSVESEYHGDGHADFLGSYRILLRIDFSFDGLIFDFKVSDKETGQTTRTKTYTKKDFLAVCHDSARAKFDGGAETTGGNSFKMNISGANPLAFVAPPIRASLTGQVQPNGDIKFKITTGDFPSQGIQVIADNKTILTDIANDASCLSKSAVTGLTGAVNLGTGLMTTNTDEITAVRSAPSTHRVRSGLCGF